MQGNNDTNTKNSKPHFEWWYSAVKNRHVLVRTYPCTAEGWAAEWTSDLFMLDENFATLCEVMGQLEWSRDFDELREAGYKAPWMCERDGCRERVEHDSGSSMFCTECWIDLCEGVGDDDERDRSGAESDEDGDGRSF